MRTVHVASLAEARQPIRENPTDEQVQQRAAEIRRDGFDELLVVYRRPDGYYEAVDDTLNVRALQTLYENGTWPDGWPASVSVHLCGGQHDAVVEAHRKALRSAFGAVAEALYAQSVLAKADLQKLEVSELSDGKSAGGQHQPGYAAYVRRLTGRKRQAATDLVHRTRIPEPVLRELISSDRMSRQRLTDVGKRLHWEQPRNPAARARELLARESSATRGKPADQGATPATAAAGDQVCSSIVGHDLDADETLEPEKQAERDLATVSRRGPAYRQRYLAHMAWMAGYTAPSQSPGIADPRSAGAPPAASLTSHAHHAGARQAEPVGPEGSTPPGADGLASTAGARPSAVTTTSDVTDEPAALAGPSDERTPAGHGPVTDDEAVAPAGRVSSGNSKGRAVGGNPNRGPEGGAASEEQVLKAQEAIQDMRRFCKSNAEVARRLDVPQTLITRVLNEHRASATTVSQIRQGYRQFLANHALPHHEGML